MYCIELEKNL